MNIEEAKEEGGGRSPTNRKLKLTQLLEPQNESTWCNLVGFLAYRQYVPQQENPFDGLVGAFRDGPDEKFLKFCRAAVEAAQMETTVRKVALEYKRQREGRTVWVEVIDRNCNALSILPSRQNLLHAPTARFGRASCEGKLLVRAINPQGLRMNLGLGEMTTEGVDGITFGRLVEVMEAFKHAAAPAVYMATGTTGR